MEIFLTLEKFHGKPNEKLQKKKMEKFTEQEFSVKLILFFRCNSKRNNRRLANFAKH